MIFRQHLFKNSLPLMNRAMDAYSLRQQTTAKNIANATSPRYRPERVKFEELFVNQEVVIKGGTDDGVHIPIGKSSGNDIEGEKMNREIPEAEIFFSGETHVNIDKEMSEMAQNQIRFRFASMATKKFFNGMSSAIRGSMTS
ncbi:MAG: flagellar basal body rod protein FlgB [Candidatus Kapaibacteriota bacterium]|jgi:flagellar basal-body rod protein FlgB